MKIGTIICNHWAGDDNPTKYQIYLGVNGRYIRVLRYHKGKLVAENAFYKDIFKKGLESGHIEIISNSKGYELVKEELKRLNKG